MQVPESPMLTRWPGRSTLPKDDWPDVHLPDGTKRLIREGEWLLAFPAGGYIVLNDKQLDALQRLADGADEIHGGEMGE